MGQPERGFLYMPFQHSEDLDDQQRSVALFTDLGDTEQLRYAKLHHDVIERFGRFPHSNATLGRTPRPDATAAGDVVPWSWRWSKPPVAIITSRPPWPARDRRPTDLHG